MATFTGYPYSSQQGAAGSSLNVNVPLERDAMAKERIIPFRYVSVGTEATADKVTLAVLPPGSKVIAAKSLIVCGSAINTVGAVGTGVTVRFGDQTTANRWAGTIDISAGGVFLFTATTGTEIITPVAIVGPTSFGTVAATDDTLTMTFVAITTLAAGKYISGFVTVLLP